MDEPRPFKLQNLLLRTIWPVFVIPYYVTRYLYLHLFGWLDRMLQSRGNESLANDIDVGMPFVSSGQKVAMKVAPQPFDYASVYINIDTVTLCITRGRNEVSASAASRDYPGDSFELSCVLEALGAEEVFELRPPANLNELDQLLERHWKQISLLFSMDHYQEFRETLQKIAKKREIFVRIMY